MLFHWCVSPSIARLDVSADAEPLSPNLVRMGAILVGQLRTQVPFDSIELLCRQRAGTIPFGPYWPRSRRTGRRGLGGGRHRRASGLARPPRNGSGRWHSARKETGWSRPRGTGRRGFGPSTGIFCLKSSEIQRRNAFGSKTVFASRRNLATKQLRNSQPVNGDTAARGGSWKSFGSENPLQTSSGERFDLVQPLEVAGLPPQPHEFLLVKGCPLGYQTERPPWKATRDQGQSIDLDPGLLSPVLSVEMRGIVVVEIHSDDDAVESADFRHQLPSS